MKIKNYFPVLKLFKLCIQWFTSIDVRLISKRLVRVVPIFILFLVSLVVALNYSSALNASFGVQPNDSWVFTVKKARRYFEYSVGWFDFSSLTKGYRLGDDLVPELEEINLTILSIQSVDQESITYQISWENTSIKVNSSSVLSEYGIQEALGRGVLGNGYDFLISDSGVSIGEWVFVVPVNMLLSNPLQIWNQSTLPGALEGMETILELGDSDNERDYHMWILYEGNMKNASEEIDLQFSFGADFRWEKSTGVLLTYEITAHMTGSYKQSFNAAFDLDLKIDRSDLNEFLGKNAAGFDLIVLISGLMILVASRIYLRKKF